MKKAAIISSLFVALFLGSIAAAQAGSHFSFGIGIGVGPAVPYGYYYQPYPYPYAYYPYAYPYYYPYYRNYIVPRYNGGYYWRNGQRYNYRYEGRGDRDRHDGRSYGNNRSRSNRGRR